MYMNTVPDTVSLYVTANVPVIVWNHKLGHNLFILNGLSVLVEPHLTFCDTCNIISYRTILNAEVE